MNIASKEKNASPFITILFLLLTVWFLISPTVQAERGGRFLGDFPSIYAVMALAGAIVGISIANRWGGWKSLIGKSIWVFSLGLGSQVVGQVIYAWYSFVQHVPLPYPSLGDIGYFGSVILYIYGVWLLARASGAHLTLKSVKSRTQVLVVPVAILATGYFLFLQGYQFDWANPVRVLLDFGYPFGQAVYVSLAVLTYLLTKGVLGGTMKKKILLILVALVFQFLSDYVFLYQSSKGTWTAGGLNDYMYLISYLLMSLSLSSFSTVE